MIRKIKQSPNCCVIAGVHVPYKAGSYMVNAVSDPQLGLKNHTGTHNPEELASWGKGIMLWWDPVKDALLSFSWVHAHMLSIIEQKKKKRAGPMAQWLRELDVTWLAMQLKDQPQWFEKLTDYMVHACLKSWKSGEMEERGLQHCGGRCILPLPLFLSLFLFGKCMHRLAN